MVFSAVISEQMDVKAYDCANNITTMYYVDFAIFTELL